MLSTNHSHRVANVFGPVPSRRLGQSLGVINIPPNTCTYDCVYCQLGRTQHCTVEPKPFFNMDVILESIAKKMCQIRNLGESVDYIAYVPSGEPTLDVNLKEQIQTLYSFGIKTAIFTNSSLIGQKEVQSALSAFDRVCLKVDTVEEPTWRCLNRPHADLVFESIMDGLLSFAESYKGMLDTETMLVRGMNDDEKSLNNLASFIGQMKPHIAFLSTPLRPPAEHWVLSPSVKSFINAYTIFDQKCATVKTLTSPEENNFVSTGNVEEDLLAITSVHPLREMAVKSLIKRSGSSWDKIEKLLESEELTTVTYKNTTYYIHKNRECHHFK